MKHRKSTGRPSPDDLKKRLNVELCEANTAVWHKTLDDHLCFHNAKIAFPEEPAPQRWRVYQERCGAWQGHWIVAPPGAGFDDCFDCGTGILGYDTAINFATGSAML